MSRRSALSKLAGGAVLATATASLSQRLAAADAAAGAELKGHINHSVCKWCYDKIPLETMCKAGKEMGLQSIELLTVDDFPTLKKYDLSCAMVSGVPGGIPSGLNRLENHDRIVEFFEQSIPKVAEAGHPNIICFSGNRKGLSDEKGIENCAIGLKRIVGLAEKHKVTVCMELLNSKVNHKDYMFDHIAWGVDVIKRVNSPRVKILYDIYHAQIMDGDIVRNIRDHYQWIGHFHTGGNPGRHDIDESQELNYPFIAKAIGDLGYTGFITHEYSPEQGHDPVATLEKAMQLVDV